MVGTQAVATASPDGYTIGIIDNAVVINPGLFRAKLPYNTKKDFAPTRSWRLRLSFSSCIHLWPPIACRSLLHSFDHLVRAGEQCIGNRLRVVGA